jgi:hypothetical protein
VKEWLDIDPPRAAFLHDELYPDAGHLLEPPPEAIRIRSLEELPEVLP